uniref:Uncharacterized protein n=1 Tax=Lygus hesperus TaxID=30085 RepID=A0A0A9WVG8_LYGHE
MPGTTTATTLYPLPAQVGATGSALPRTSVEMQANNTYYFNTLPMQQTTAVAIPPPSMPTPTTTSIEVTTDDKNSSSITITNTNNDNNANDISTKRGNYSASTGDVINGTSDSSPVTTVTTSLTQNANATAQNTPFSFSPQTVQLTSAAAPSHALVAPSMYFTAAAQAPQLAGNVSSYSTVSNTGNYATLPSGGTLYTTQFPIGASNTNTPNINTSLAPGGFVQANTTFYTTTPPTLSIIPANAQVMQTAMVRQMATPTPTHPQKQQQ